MTVLALPAQPGTDSGGNLRPVPWQRMLWVTWRQHRAMFISILAVFGAIAVFLVVAGLKVHRDYANLIATPANSAAWHQLNSQFNNEDWTMGNTLLILMQLVPVLIGAFAGASVLAKDLETGTFRFAWTQGLSRGRWAIAKLAVIGLFVAVVAGAFGQLFAWFFAPFIRQEDLTVLEATVFGTRDIAFAAWTLAAFMIAAFGGMLLRRIIPAMAATLGVYLGLQLLTWGVLRPHYPVSRFWPMQFAEGGWLLAASILLAAATVWLVRHRAA
jgi:ABC-type transport system involved in multi-copper enzyme maturation permease subunit